ncbi:hypothetical protein [Piscirickettsia salmonis]|uniref:hypothetical protein n=1 Tax=Piscirickettsia salmonis TaxID=1238 RepID=UPI0007C885B9|nr:hypothetical protein A0O36_02357 [Piscirickettsiaceae bacterium NZ-RLO1]
MPKISRIAIFGDSLSDSGLMNEEKILDMIPLPGTGLDTSGSGRFANGLAWPGFVGLQLFRGTFKRLGEEFFDSAEKEVSYEKIRKHFHRQLINGDVNENAKVISFDVCGMQIDNYAVGGATASRYSAVKGAAKKLEKAAKLPFRDPLKFGNRLVSAMKDPGDAIAHVQTEIQALGARGVVTNLTAERQVFLKREQKSGACDQDEVLIVEWTGANDLITVSSKVTMASADRAIHAL